MKLVLTGIGERNAETSIRSVIAKTQPRVVISSGFAGALDPSLPVGTVVYDCDDTLPLADHLAAHSARPVRFHCSHDVVITSAAKDRLWRSTGAQSVEMESQIVRTVCREAGIPSATIRVISDAADEDLPLDFNQCMTTDFRISYAKVLRLVLKSRRGIGKLITFQRRLGRASEALTIALVTVLEQLSARATRY